MFFDLRDGNKDHAVNPYDVRNASESLYIYMKVYLLGTHNTHVVCVHIQHTCIYVCVNLKKYFIVYREKYRNISLVFYTSNIVIIFFKKVKS